MPSKLQDLGKYGEDLVRTKVFCPSCKSKKKSLRSLPTNFRCADLICDFCGYLAQVKTGRVVDPSVLPKAILGAAWEPQRERMEAGIYFPLFIVLVDPKKKSRASIYYLPADMQTREMFVPRNKLSLTAKRAGWQGFMIDLTKAVAPPFAISPK